MPVVGRHGAIQGSVTATEMQFGITQGGEGIPDAEIQTIFMVLLLSFEEITTLFSVMNTLDLIFLILRKAWMCEVWLFSLFGSPHPTTHRAVYLLEMCPGG